MKTNGKVKRILDVCMTIALFFLMGYQFWGETAHEWIGAGMFLLFLAHQALNFNWYKNLFRGKYTPVRKLFLVIDLLTLTAMLSLMYSGIVMSRHVFAFLPIKGGMALARRLHLLGSYWGFLLMGLHLGLHWQMVVHLVSSGLTRGMAKTDRLPAKGNARVLQFLPFVGGLAIAGYGVYVFIKRDFATYLFLRSEFVFIDYEESKILFLCDHIALMGLCIFLAHYSVKLLGKSKR